MSPGMTSSTPMFSKAKAFTTVIPTGGGAFGN